MGEYLDFELRLEKKGQRYQATVVRSPGGEASCLFKLPFSKLELENFVLRMEGVRRGMRRIRSPEMEMVRQFGDKLFEAVFNDDVLNCYVSGQNEAKNRGAGLRMKLRLESPELINIPWEFLYDDSAGRFLALFEDTPVVRYVDVRERNQPLKVKPPIHVLVMVSSPDDYPHLDVEHEKDNLKAALGSLIDDGMIRITWIEKATLPNLAEYLLRGSYHVFHFIGHGGFDERSQDGILVFEDEKGRGQWASGERLAVLLGNQTKMRMVILNACEGGRTSSDDPFAGVATTLLRTGSVPAVVAMQLAITDTAAITFARGFYSAVSVGKPVDAAVTQARLAIFAAGNDVEWGTPVLYMRSPDGVIFDIQSLTPEERTAMQLAAEKAREEEERRLRLETELREKARVKKRQSQEATAPEKNATEQHEQQEHEARARALEEERNQQIDALLAEGRQHLQAGEAGRAAETMKQLLALSPGHAQGLALLEQAEETIREASAQADQQARLAELHNQALARLEAQDWDGADGFLAQIEALDPDFPGIAEARERVRVGQEQTHLAARLASANEFLREGKLEDAKKAFQQLLEWSPDHPEAQRGLAEAFKKEQANEQYVRALGKLSAGNLADAAEGFQAALRLDAAHAQAASHLRDVLVSIRAKEKAAEEEVRQRAENLRQAELARLYDAGDNAARAMNWAEAIRNFQDVLARDPTYRDTRGRVAQVQHAKAAAEAEAQMKADVKAAFSRALAHFQAQQWEQAIAGMQEVLAQDANFTDAVVGRADGLLAWAKQMKERQEMPPPPVKKVAANRPTTLPEEKATRSKPTNLPK